MEVTFAQLVVVLVSGLAAGFINTLAGGGSFITLVALDYAGLPVLVANGTNRVAVEAGAVMSTLGFRSKGVFDFRLAVHFAVPGLLGSVLGALITSSLPAEVFRRVIAGAMLLMLFTLLFDSKRWLKTREIVFTPQRRFWTYVTFFVIGIYGGAIQAGVGFVLTAALVLLAGQDLVRTAFFKVFTVGVYTAFAVLTFALQGQVNWVLGMVLSVGTGVGAWLTSRLAVAKGERLVKWVLAVMLAVMSMRYLGIIRWFG